MLYIAGLCEAEIAFGGCSHILMLSIPPLLLSRAQSPNWGSHTMPVQCECFTIMKKQGAAGEERTLLCWVTGLSAEKMESNSKFALDIWGWKTMPLNCERWMPVSRASFSVS